MAVKKFPPPLSLAGRAWFNRYGIPMSWVEERDLASTEAGGGSKAESWKNRCKERGGRILPAIVVPLQGVKRPSITKIIKAAVAAESGKRQVDMVQGRDFGENLLRELARYDDAEVLMVMRYYRGEER